MPAVIRDPEDSEESSSEDEEQNVDKSCIAWCGLSKTIPVLLFFPEAVVSKDGKICSIGAQYNLTFKIVRTDSRLVRGLLTNHGFREVNTNCNDFNLMWTGSHPKPFTLRSLQDFQKVNHFPRSYELTRKDRLFKNIQRMQQVHGFKNFHIVPQTFVLPSEYQEFCDCFAKDKGPWIIKPVASSRGRGIYLVSNPNQISMDENILVSRYINDPLLIDDFKFDVRLYVLVTSYDPLIIYVYEEGLARFATVKYDQTSKSIKNTFMHLTNYSVNKKSSDYVSCDDPEVEDYGNKWSMSAVLRYLRQEGKDTTLLMRQVEDLVVKAVLSAELHIATASKMFVPHKTNCFELYGFDVLIDSNLKPWLLEVNLSPSLACDAPLDLKIKASMISDMFSLVGFVCQDPLSRLQRSDRVTLDTGFKHPARPQQQRPASSGNPVTEGSKDKQGAHHGQGDSTLSLTAEEVKVLRRIKEEYERRGGFIRIFPTAETWDLYSGYLESKTSMNYMLASRLFHGRNVNGNVQLQVDGVHRCHVVQYERKLQSLEARKRRQRHLTLRSASKGKQKKTGKESKACPVERGGRALDSAPHKVAEHGKKVAAPAPRSSEATAASCCAAVNLLGVLQQGWDLSKVQARMAFSSYLHRVQERLLAESRGNAAEAWPDKDDDQMELVMRFLRRAATNLQQDMKVVLPSCQLPLQDRRRILSHQLGDFINSYNKETEQMDNRKEAHCVSPGVFQEYIAAASESDLEEVLTFYTQKNKTPNVFLGTKVRGFRRDVGEIGALGDSGLHENSETLSVAREDSSTSESSLSAGKASRATERTPSVRALSEGQQQPRVAGRARPDVRASRLRCSLPATLGSPPALASSAPLPCPLPPPPPPPSLPPPQPPSYAQSLAKSQFCRSLGLADPPAYPSAAVVAQPRALRRIQSFTTPASSVPSAAHIYRQKLSRPTSAGQVKKRSSSGKPKSISAEAAKGPDSLLDQAQSNQRAFVSALQKLADKQVARHYSSSSHINLLTQHLTNLNLANRMLSRDCFTLNPKVRPAVPAAQGPLKAVHSGRDQPNSTGLRSLKEDEALWDGQLQNAYSLVTGVSSQQRYQPTQGSYQLQFAIQQLQQQKRSPPQLLDKSQRAHQTQFRDKTSAPHIQALANSPSFAPSGIHDWPPPGHLQAPAYPALAPKPPSSAREGQLRKTATKRLIKQTSSESLAGRSATSGQHPVHEAICGKTGLLAYHRLLQGPEPGHR